MTTFQSYLEHAPRGTMSRLAPRLGVDRTTVYRWRTSIDRPAVPLPADPAGIRELAATLRQLADEMESSQ